MSYRYRYAPDPTRPMKRRTKPEEWVTGPDPIRHEKYYAFLKHKAQARYRDEEYKLTWPEWEAIWEDDEDWLARGRGVHDLCLAKLDREKPWEWDNVKLMKRMDYLKMPRIFKAKVDGE